MIFTKKKSDSELKRLVSKFGALGDPNRLKIVRILATHKDICVSEVASKLGISTAGVSQHMRILEQAGLVKKHRMGQKICYEVNARGSENSKIYKMVIS